MSDNDCEACGLVGGAIVGIYLLNGRINLCGQCRDDINRKSPLLLKAESELAACRGERQDYDMATMEIDGLKKANALLNRGMEVSEEGRMEYKLEYRELESELAALRASLSAAVELLRRCNDRYGGPNSEVGQWLSAHDAGAGRC